MNQDSNPKREFLEKAKMPASVAGGGICGLLVTAVMIQTLGPVVVVAGGVAAGAATYQWINNRPHDDWEEE